MVHDRTYAPHCPTPNCTGGGLDRLHKVEPESVKITREIAAQKMSEGDIVFRCSYCGFVWAQKSSNKPGIDPKPIGFYKNLEFREVVANYEIRPTNRSSYYN